MIFNIAVILLINFFLRLSFLKALPRTAFLVLSSKFFLSTTLFLFFITFTSMNYLLDYYQEVETLGLHTGADVQLLLTLNLNRLLSLTALGLGLVEVYCFPFIYVFLLVTTLSIVFCLTYNTDELYSFMFYCKVILLAGYMLFFTDSLVLFFLAYEMLLVPSFFILYKFAKTRRAVEAAYLMFF